MEYWSSGVTKESMVMENHHFQWKITMFNGRSIGDMRYRTTTDGCSIAMLVYRRISLFFESLAVVTWKLLRFERPFWREKGRVEMEGERPIVLYLLIYVFIVFYTVWPYISVYRNMIEYDGIIWYHTYILYTITCMLHVRPCNVDSYLRSFIQMYIIYSFFRPWKLILRFLHRRTQCGNCLDIGASSSCACLLKPQLHWSSPALQTVDSIYI